MSDDPDDFPAWLAVLIFLLLLLGILGRQARERERDQF